MSENQKEERIRQVSISEQMKSAYIDYSMSVIVARALPDVRDGMKPVHRRVLYGMNELGLASNKEFKKSARIVGEVLGKYHPHGDSSVYFAMVRMAQPWSLRYMLVKGQGNYGSVDGDSPAAMRYTEAKLESIAEYLLQDIDKDTVDFKNNFDDSLTEPTVLPARFPNLLVNGASGIAVGMATNMPPHNLKEAIDGCLQYIDNPNISIEELLKYVKAPDFPTGGTIYGYQGVKESYETGRGRIVVRSKTTVEVYPNGREALIVYEIPYQVNKKELIQRIADLVNEGKLEGISDMRDESNKEGMRIVIELKRDTVANVVLNNLFKHTAMQTSFGVNNIAIVKGRPKALNLKDLIRYFVEFRDEVVIRRSKFDLKNAEAKIHIIEGLLKALNHIDEIIALIKNSETPDFAKNGLIEKFEFSELQAIAILDMTLRKLTGLEGEKLLAEFNELKKLIEFLNHVINDFDLRKKIIKEELVHIKEKYGDERRTDIVYSSEEFNPEDFFADDHMVITISHLGYIKRTSLVEFQTQNRGGIGAKGGATRDEDFIENMFVATMHNTLLLFTEKGRCFWLKVYEIPEGTKTSKGRAIQNILNIEQEDNVKAVINVKTLKNEEYINNHYIILATKKGIVKKSSLEVYSRPRQNGVNAVTIKDGDQLIEASLTNGKKDILLGVRKGKAIRFPEAKIRVIGRTAAGVKGVTLSGKEDEVIGMVCTDPTTNPDIMVVSENGFGKRTKIEDYRITNRGGKGVKTINITDKTGDLIAIKEVNDSTDLMIINKSGIVIRFAIADIRTSGRATQGVKLINLKGSDSIAAIATAKDFLPEIIEDEELEFFDDVIENEIIESSVIIEPKEEIEEN